MSGYFGRVASLQVIGASMKFGLPTNGGNIDVAGLSHVGRVRSSNEDRFCALKLPEISGVEGLLAVADGLGGRPAGSVAAEIAVEALTRRFRSRAWGDLLRLARSSVRTRLKSSVDVANRSIIARGASVIECAGMATTLTVAAVRSRKVVIAHVGDCRAYLIHNGTIEQLTSDHSLAVPRVRNDDPPPDEAADRWRQTVVTRALGLREEIAVEVFERDLPVPASLLLCSDGLYRHITESEILAIVNGGQVPKEVCKTLISAANERGGSDNVTAVVACIR